MRPYSMFSPSFYIVRTNQVERGTREIEIERLKKRETEGKGEGGRVEMKRKIKMHILTQFV